MVDYFTMQNVPGKVFFQCDRMRAKLSTAACEAMWRKADEFNDGTNGTCRLCPIGAVHAGEVAASMSPLKGSMTCSRCHRTAMRLIKRHLCPSCYNRDAEESKGRNGRGKKPVKIGRIDQRSIRYLHGDEPRTMVVRRSVDVDELLVAALRDSRQRVTFAFHAQPAAIMQWRLW